MIGLKFVIRRKKFDVGEALLLSEHDVHEICMMFADFAVHTKKQIVEFAKRHEIVIHEKQKA